MYVSRVCYWSQWKRYDVISMFLILTVCVACALGSMLTLLRLCCQSAAWRCWDLPTMFLIWSGATNCCGRRLHRYLCWWFTESRSTLRQSLCLLRSDLCLDIVLILVLYDCICILLQASIVVGITDFNRLQLFVADVYFILIYSYVPFGRYELLLEILLEYVVNNVMDVS